MDTEYVRARTWATTRALWPDCHAHRHRSGRRTARCWRPMWHRGSHRYGNAIWPRADGPVHRAIRWVAGRRRGVRTYGPGGPGCQAMHHCRWPDCSCPLPETPGVAR